MEIIKLKINELKPFVGNAKKHPKEQVEQIKRSIVEFGMNYTSPIKVDTYQNQALHKSRQKQIQKSQMVDTKRKFKYA
jgi:hypothetical protein